MKKVHQNLKKINISNVNIIKLAKCVFIMYMTTKKYKVRQRDTNETNKAKNPNLQGQRNGD